MVCLADIIGRKASSPKDDDYLTYLKVRENLPNLPRFQESLC